MKGALEKILQQCTKYMSNGSTQPLNTKKEQEYLAEAYEIGRKGLRGTADSTLLFLQLSSCLTISIYSLSSWS